MSIETLLIKQAQLSDLRRRLKAEGAAESDKCERYRRDGKGLACVYEMSCIENLYKDWRYHFDEDPHGEPGFEEVWEDAVLEGEVCQHCQNVRSLKRQRMDAGRSLAGVRAAITRVGRRLAKEQAA